MFPEIGMHPSLIGLVALATLGAGSDLVAGSLLRQPRGLARLLASAVVFGSAETIGMEVLGTLGWIGVWPLLAWSMAILGAGLAGRVLLGDGPDAPKDPAAEAPAGWSATIALGLILSVAFLFGVPSIFSAVKVVSDGPIYHLYFAARWWKAGGLILVAAPFGENAATYFPANGDLWFTWLMTIWGGDALAKIGQAPFLVVAGAAAYATARLLGGGRTSSIVATCWFLSSTPLLLFSFEPNVDTIFIAGYLLAVYFFLRYAIADGGPNALAIGALAAGIAIGTKPTAIVFVPPLLLLVIAGLLASKGNRRDRIVSAATVAILPVSTGGFWFLRDFWLTGNPLYPLDLRIMGQTILSGWYGPEAMRWSSYYLPVSRLTALADTVLAILDPRMAPLWLVAVVGIWAVRNPRTKPVRGWIALFAMGAVANILLYWLAIPYRTQQRFMLHGIGLAVVPLAATFDRARWLQLLATILLAVHLTTPQGWPIGNRDPELPWDLDPIIPNAVSSLLVPFPRIEPTGGAGNPAPVPMVRPLILSLIATMILAVRAWQGLWFGPTIGKRSRGGRLAAALVITALAMGIGWVEVGGRALDPPFRFYPPFRDFYAGWRALERAGGTRGARVAYAGTNIPYYLLGQGLRNEVRYVNVDAHRDWLLHDYHREARARGAGLWPNSRPGWDRTHPDYNAWLANLNAERIQLLVVTRVNPSEGPHNVADAEGFPIERRWADEHPDRFHPLYGQAEGDPWFRLYRVVSRFPS